MEIRVWIRVGSRDADRFRSEPSLVLGWRSREMMLGLVLVGLTQVGLELADSH